MTIEVRDDDAGSQKNNEKKGYMPALGLAICAIPKTALLERVAKRWIPAFREKRAANKETEQVF